LTGQEEQIGGFDVVYKAQPVVFPVSAFYSTYLGAYNNRKQ